MMRSTYPAEVSGLQGPRFCMRVSDRDHQSLEDGNEVNFSKHRLTQPKHQSGKVQVVQPETSLDPSVEKGRLIESLDQTNRIPGTGNDV